MVVGKVWLESMSQVRPGQASLTFQCALMYKLRLHVTRELFLNGILFYNIMNIRIMYCIYYGIIIIKIFLPSASVARYHQYTRECNLASGVCIGWTGLLAPVLSRMTTLVPLLTLGLSSGLQTDLLRFASFSLLRRLLPGGLGPDG